MDRTFQGISLAEQIFLERLSLLIRFDATLGAGGSTVLCHWSVMESFGRERRIQLQATEKDFLMLVTLPVGTLRS